MMKNISVMLAVVIAGLNLASQAKAQETNPSIKSLSFILGCWELNDAAAKRLVSEQWMSPAGSAMIGMSRTVRNDKMGAFEYLRIVEDETGINYISRPSENKEDTAFKLVKWSINRRHSKIQSTIFLRGSSTSWRVPISWLRGSREI